MIYSRYEHVTEKVQKTQITFSNKHVFACISLPLRKKKGWPEICIILTLGLGHKLEHPRVAVSVEPYPGRWTHHILIQHESEADTDLLELISEAYHFANEKGRRY